MRAHYKLNLHINECSDAIERPIARVKVEAEYCGQERLLIAELPFLSAST